MLQTNAHARGKSSGGSTFAALHSHHPEWPKYQPWRLRRRFRERAVVFQLRHRPGYSNEQSLDLDRQLTDPYAGGVIDGARDGRRHPRQSDLTDPPSAKRIQLRVGDLDEMDLQRGHVRVCRDDVVGEIGIDRRAASRVVRSLLEE